MGGDKPYRSDADDDHMAYDGSAVVLDARGIALSGNILNPVAGSLDDAALDVASPALARAAKRSQLNPAAVFLAGLAPGSRRTMRAALETLADLATSGRADAFSCPWHSMRYAHTQALRSVLRERYAPANVNKHLSALRGVLKEAWRLGWMRAEELARASDVKNVRGHALPVGRALRPRELDVLFAHCFKDERPQGARDAALLAVLYGGGLRRSEAADLAVSDIVDGALRVRGKGAKERRVPVAAWVMEWVSRWLEVRGAGLGALFLQVHRLGRILAKGISAHAVMRMCQRRAAEAEIDVFSPHDLRRTYIGDLLQAGADIVTIKRLAGHESVETTSRYDRRGELEKDRAAAMLRRPGIE